MQTTSDMATSLERGLRVTAGLIVGLVLIQAGIAGQFLFGQAGIAIHGHIANGLFVLGFGAALMAWRAGVDRATLSLTGALLLLLFVQTGLGYAGRTSLDAAALHIPNGVAIMGVASVLYMRLR